MTRTTNLSSKVYVFICLLSIVLFAGCGDTRSKKKEQAKTMPSTRLKVIFDTDANNELDDQHAMAYLLLNGDVFDVAGITVNATYNGGDIQGHYHEAERILQLCNLKDSIPLL
jgi:hypothetical protein